MQGFPDALVVSFGDLTAKWQSLELRSFKSFRLPISP